VWIWVLGGCCAVDALLLSNARILIALNRLQRTKFKSFLI